MINNFFKFRGSGILAHITSLPSRFGIGDIGLSSYVFLDFLHKANQRVWQILPSHPTHAHFDHSPYMSSSAFAGSYLLISPQLLIEDDLVRKESLIDCPVFSPYFTEFTRVEEFKKKLLHEAFLNFDANKEPFFDEFAAQNAWVEDYALFMAAKEKWNDSPWYSWPQDIARRNPAALAELTRNLQDTVNYYTFEQYIFYKQWRLLKKRAAEAKVKIFGDIPIYVSLDSADVWANQEIFTLRRDSLRPSHVAGVPPDYFAKTGQRWGNPLYRWNSRNEKTQQKLMAWWEKRFSHIFQLVDIARVDHFRGFESYWSIPEENTTAVDGVWLKGPGKTFFDTLKKKLGELPIVAEDLGIITPNVEKLRDELGFPGMKILQFAFDGNPQNAFLPYNFSTQNCIVYTGTHDNDTTVGWFLSEQVSEAIRHTVRRLANRADVENSSIHRDMMHLAYSSTSALAIIPLQDILGFGGDCRMNTPGTATGNWKWRCAPEYLTDFLADSLSDQARLYGRSYQRPE